MKSVTIRTPLVPNFVFIEVNGVEIGSVSIAEVSDEDLKEVAERWSKALLEHAQSRRDEKARTK